MSLMLIATSGSSSTTSTAALGLVSGAVRRGETLPAMGMSDALSVFYRSGIRADQCSTVVFVAKARGDPGLIRTGDLRFRKPPLYPPELRGRTAVVCSTKPTQSRTAEVILGSSISDQLSQVRVLPVATGTAYCSWRA